MSVPAAEAAPIAEDLAQIAAIHASGLASQAFKPRETHGVIPLSLPPEGSFPSFESLKEAAQNHAKLAGWAIVTGPGGEIRNGRHIKFLNCKHTQKLDKRAVDEVARKKEGRVSKRTNCAVRMKVNERRDSSWELRWLVGRTQHNYGVNDASACHEHRRLDDTQIRLLHANHASGIPASRTKSALEKTDSELIITSRDIYNRTAKIERELRQGKEPNQAFIDELTELREKGLIIFEYEIDETTRRIQKIFMADIR
jgi:hypothetical protein